MALNKTMTFDLELKPGGIPPIVHASQGDIGRMFKANIYWDGSAATSYISGATVNLRGRKPDKTVFDYTATLAGSMVTFETTEQMTIISGPVECELVFTNDGDIIASANFVLIVEDSPYDPNNLSESEVEGLTDVLAGFQRLNRDSNGVVKIGDGVTASGTAEPIKGFYVHDEESNTDGVAQIALDAIEGVIQDDIAPAVTNWLDDHPEATTTVQDGAISYEKLDNALQETADTVAVNSDRIDNLVANAGDTDNNAELLDIRVDAYGATHPTAGGSVRTITDNLAGVVLKTYGASDLTWNVGNVAPSDGSDAASTTRIRTKKLFAKKGSYVKTASGYKTNAFLFSLSGIFEGALGSFDSTQKLIDHDCYVRFTLGTNANTTITDELIAEILANTTLVLIVGSNIVNDKAIRDRLFNETLLMKSALFPTVYVDHLFINMTGSNNQIIGAESIDNLRVAARLGFKVTEASVHKTSDDKYIVFHGNNGKIGPQFEDAIGNNDYSDVAINSKTLEWLQTNLVNRSTVPRFKTPPLSFEEWLIEAKTLGLVPYFNASDVNTISIADKIVGKGNYIAWEGPRDEVPGYIQLSANGNTTKAQFLNACNDTGLPCMTGIGLNQRTDEELKEIVEALHENGYIAMWNSCYESVAQTQRALKFGMDFSTSAWDIPDFKANLDMLSSDTGFSGFSHNGTENADGSLTLTAGQYVEYHSTRYNNEFLTGSSLRVQYTGDLHVQCGAFLDGHVTGNGTFDNWFSTYHLTTEPWFTLIADDTVTIKRIEYKTAIF